MNKNLEKLLFLVFLKFAYVNTLFDVCPRYKCDSELEKDFCGKIKTVQDEHSKELYREFHLFPCANHKLKCHVNDLTDFKEAKCKEISPHSQQNTTNSTQRK